MGAELLHQADPRAHEVLEQAYHLLQERASWIDDEALRRSYLENVPANREIAALYRAGGGGTQSLTEGIQRGTEGTGGTRT